MKLIAAALAVLGLSGLWFRWQRRATGPVQHRLAGAAATITASAALSAAVLLAGYAWLASPPREHRTVTLATPPPAAKTSDASLVAPGHSPAREGTDASPTTDRCAEPSAKPADPDAPLRRLVVGTWEDHYQGKRTMMLKPDGTGTMLVELSGISAILFAERLRFDMVWSLEQGRLKKQTLGGEPADKVELILKTMGDRVDERILELTDQRLLLLDGNGKTQYDWKRVHSPGADGDPSPDDREGTATKDTQEHEKDG
jgi:hypothetical protein